MTRTCPVDGEVFPDDPSMCPKHVRPTVAAEDTPAADVPVEPTPQATRQGDSWSTEVCWHCGKPPPNPGNRTCLERDCGRSLTPPALHIQFQGGEVDLEIGDRVELGRHGAHARVFGGFANVSRRHAVIGVDDDGRVWIRPHLTPNGTFVNETEIPPSIDRTLVSGDTVRFALNAKGTIRIYDR